MTTTTPSPPLSAIELRAKLRASFPEFVAFHLKRDGHQFAPLNGAMAEFLARPSRVKLLLAARGFSKSTLGILYAGWRLLRVPSTRIHITSHADHSAATIAERLLSLMRESPVLAPLAPPKGCSKTAWTIRYAAPERDPSVSCSGIKGSRTGLRADLVVVDDAETVENSGTPAMREELLGAMGELPKLLHDQLRLIRPQFGAEQWEGVKPQLVATLPESTQLLYIGTYQSTESVYIVPEVSPEAEGGEQDGHPLATADVGRFPAITESGESAFPEKFSLEELLFRKATDTAQSWRLHYLLDPTPFDSAHSPIKWEQIVRASDADKPRSIEAYLDPTGHSKDHHQRDELALLFGGQGADGALICWDLVAWKSTDVFQSYERVVRACAEAGVHRLHVESQDPTQAQVLRRIVADLSARAQQGGGAPIRLMVEPFGAGTRSKEARVVEALETGLMSGACKVHPRVLAQPETERQLRGVRYGRLPTPDDRVDILATFIARNAERIRPAQRRFEAARAF